MIESKTWLPSEIWELMAAEMKAYKHDCQVRQLNLSYLEMAENVYRVLDEKGLIEHTP
jgi:hypothetical protein